MSNVGEMGFIIKGPNSILVVVDDSQLFGPSILKVELWAAWADIIYARRTLQANRLVIKGDSSIVIHWI